jgi:hypothetical protein
LTQRGIPRGLSPLAMFAAPPSGSGRVGSAMQASSISVLAHVLTFLGPGDRQPIASAEPLEPMSHPVLDPSQGLLVWRLHAQQQRARLRTEDASARADADHSVSVGPASVCLHLRAYGRSLVHVVRVTAELEEVAAWPLGLDARCSDRHRFVSSS